MPKSRRSKSRKGKSRPGPQVAVQPEATTPISEPAPPAQVSRKSAQSPVAATRYHYVTAEMRRVGILAGILLVILVVVALVW